MAVLARTRRNPTANGAEMPSGLPFRFSVRQYRRMAEEGILTEDDRVELLEGWIIPKMTHKPPHDASVDLTQHAVSERLPEGWRVRVQSAVSTSDSEPEPDVAVVRGGARRYARSHPKPRDIGMLIEVAEASLQQDRVQKGRLYARARIPVYWVINLLESVVEVYTRPRGGKHPAYQQREDYEPGDDVPLVLDGKEVARIPVRDLLALSGEED